MAEQESNQLEPAPPPAPPRAPALEPAPQPALATQFKVVQGQARQAEERARRADERAASLEAMVQNLTVAVSRGQSQTQNPDPLDEDVDPSIRAEFVRMRQEIASLSAQRQQDLVQSEEKKWRDNALVELETTAELAGVEFSALRRQIETLPTKELWAEGKRLIREAKNGSALDESRIRADERAKALKEHGIYTEPRPTHGARPRTRGEEDAAYASGDLSTEEYSVLLKKRGG